MNKNKKIIIGILIVVLIVVMGVVIAYKLIENSVTNRANFNFKVENISSNSVATENNEKNVQNDVITKADSNTRDTSFTRTYNVLNVADSNDENYLYLTISQFQSEEIKTVKVQRSIASSIEKGNNYEFTFQYTDNIVEDSIESIFTNTVLVAINKTEKQGLEQVQDSIAKYEETKKTNREAEENKIDENLEEQKIYQDELNQVGQEIKELVN